MKPAAGLQSNVERRASEKTSAVATAGSQLREKKSGAAAAQAFDLSGASSGNEPRLLIRTCKHILDNGAFCRAAAVAGSPYCPAHRLLRQRLRRMARAHRRAGVIILPKLTDLTALQKAEIQVRVALEAGHIEPERARVVRYALRQLAADLRYQQRLEQALTAADGERSFKVGR